MADHSDFSMWSLPSNLDPGIPLTTGLAGTHQQYGIPAHQSFPTQHDPPSLSFSKDKDHIYQPMIMNADDLDAVKREHESLNNREVGLNAETNEGYPNTPHEQQQLVQKLFNAIVDFSDYREKDSDYQLSRVKDLSNIEVHIIAWDILLATQSAHRGEIGFASRSWAPEWAWEEYRSFSERFAAVVDCCKHVKSMVYGDVKASFARRIASAPVREKKRNDTNAGTNKKRADNIKAGRVVRQALRGAGVAREAAAQQGQGASATQPSGSLNSFAALQAKCGRGSQSLTSQHSDINEYVNCW
ncbi:hypothetical protein B0T16DRAFT_461986 [Cercophora newfieldiana]|uniref:Uncharacterized protein n=1 Tax=Cercophora newfieldiana TaxID=92897 RepID=A0AA40CLM0_9PEZI|nr:hypothetical protein B0T16DRAFT_461986 [Cercophora newfieldiana]